MPSAISQAQAAGKKLIIEEWGSLGGSGRTANLNSNVSILLTDLPRFSE
jgi:mannan endo-1,4-beta-mannosidase